MCVVIGIGTPAMSEISVLQPAVALTTTPASTRPRLVSDRGDAAVARSNPVTSV